ncbi:hypothetical protein QJQ45_019220 [Haematococcus lacustris]|nr:hypothetical protein QJQ45_019220 [Haematococcus lacustris]
MRKSACDLLHLAMRSAQCSKSVTQRLIIGAPASPVLPRVTVRACASASKQWHPLSASAITPAALLLRHKTRGRTTMVEAVAPTTEVVAAPVAGAVTADSNPLLVDTSFPLYDKVTAEHVVPGVRALLAALHAEIDALEQNVVPTWSGLVEPLERIQDRHQRTWGVVSHLKVGVRDSEALRKAVEEVQPENVKLGLRLSQSSALGLAAQQAKKEGHEAATPETGPWLLTLDFPSYFAVMTHAKSRALREELYRANITRASSGGGQQRAHHRPGGQPVGLVLALRQEKAALLGFSSFADLSMASKVGWPPWERAEALLEELRAASFKAGQKDLADVTEYAVSQGFPEAQLKWWDMSFWAERLREARYSLNEEELRPYFALPSVLSGMFQLASRLFDVEVVAADGEVPVWNPDVRFFKLLKAGQPKAYFYLDPYSRPAEKRGGAWMAEVVGQSKLFAPPGQAVRLPVAHMVCNQMPPIGSQPSLMTFREVETLFHEFGHALQHMLTEVELGLVSGIRGVEWDAVELPSQFMENWCYDKKTLYSFAKHFETGEPLPEESFQRLKAAKTFRSGTMMLRQIHFSLVDLELHARYTPGKGETVFERDAQVAKKTQVRLGDEPFPEDRFLCSFSHIFAGGYSAGYFSYKWAEVLSADAFGAFEDAGLDDESAVKATGQRFRDTVLALGGSVAPLEVFKAFRGREPSTVALLKHNDLAVAAA